MPADKGRIYRGFVKAKKRKIRWKAHNNTTDVKRIAQSVVKKQMSRNIETKMLEVHNSFLSVTTASPHLALLSTMVQGITDSDLIGTKARLTSLWIRYNLALGDATNYLRIVVFQDRNMNTIVPAVVDVFPNHLIDPINGFSAKDAVPARFTILYDRVVTLDSDDTLYHGEINLKSFPKKTLEFNGNPSLAPAEAKGHLYLLVMSDSAFAPDPQIAYTYRLYYKDA